MIEVIRHGTFRKGTAKCPKCGCEFSFDDRDVEHTLRANGYSYSEDASIHCPECGVTVTDLKWHEDVWETDWVFENNADVVLPIWIARDRWEPEDADGPLHIFGKKPIRLASDVWGGECGPIVASIPEKWFPWITWEHEPVEAELTNDLKRE